MQLGNRQTDLDTGTGTSRSPEPAWASWLQSWKIWSYGLQEPCRSLGFLKRDSSTSLQEFGRIRQVKSYIDNTASFSQGDLAWLSWTCLDFSWWGWGGSGEGWEGTSFPHSVAHCWRNPFHSCSTQGLRWTSMTQGWGVGERGRCKNIWEHY